ncbi:hypothetical protein [Lentibacillus saliphilus]|uniref:hypothetical protein n=1 Tax=Lentibacillus saliphilus TaxID=2737028 RepID=UPI001C30D7F8|nr:hypothetical protein [Lentibacillus saliphilus]
MRLFFLLFIILAMTLGGCSSATLFDAIEKNGRENVEILFQDDTDNVVLFLSEDYAGNPMLSLNTFLKEKSGYKYDSGTGEHAQSLDLSNKYEIIKVTSVGRNSFGALWGGVFNYPNAKTVSYSLKDEDGNVIYNSNVKITKTNIVYEKLPQHLYEQTQSLHYKILDDKNNVIVEW